MQNNPTTTRNEEHRKQMEARKIITWNFWGRPAKYDTNTQLEESIQDYFDTFYQDDNIVILHDKKWQQTWWDYKRIPSITWLALHLGFESRQSLIDYDNKAEFSDTIKKAKLFVENFNEERLLQWKGYWPWIMFNLKNNFKWVDKSEVDNNIKGELNVNEYKNLTTEQLLEIKNKKTIL